MNISRHMRIEGYVQGVGFRYAMETMARQLGVVGWARNCLDGSVEAIVCGNQRQIDEIIAWARQGPRLANVTRLEVSEAEDPQRNDFIILPNQ